MSNNPNQQNLTAQQVEEMRRQGEKQEQNNITVDNKQVLPPQEQRPPAESGRSTVNEGAKINKLILQTQFVKIEITDPNILDELNTPEKYPIDIPFLSLECNINRHGGRLNVTTSDKKEINRDALSGVSRKEMENITSWKVERG